MLDSEEQAKQVQLFVMSTISDLSGLTTFIYERTFKINTYTIIKRKSDSCIYKDHIKERDIIFCFVYMVDINTEQPFHRF